MNSIQKPIMIDIDIGDQLTSISCGHVVVELLKFIAYQRLQIPFAYQWLKQVVNKKKMCENQDKKDSFQAERHFRIASTALENLDFIIKNLLQEISGSSIPEEVCIVLGSTQVTCKEVYRILLPTLCHKPQCHSKHIASDQKIQQKVFKALVTSDKLSHVFFSALAPTNTYVFMKKRLTNQEVVMTSDSFVQYNGCRIPRSSKIIVIDLRTHSKDNISCCNDFQVFEEAATQDLVDLQIDDQNDSAFNEIESTNRRKWYQSTYVMKGFKDCIVNGSSVMNMWLEC